MSHPLDPIGQEVLNQALGSVRAEVGGAPVERSGSAEHTGGAVVSRPAADLSVDHLKAALVTVIERCNAVHAGEPNHSCEICNPARHALTR